MPFSATLPGRHLVSTIFVIPEEHLIRWQTLRRRLLVGLGLSLLIFAALAIWGGLRDVWEAFLDFHWAFLPLVLAFTVLNYALRWWKWHYYLRHLGIHDVRRSDSILLFLAGMTMAVTPGKIGEVFKSYLLKRLNDTPISRSAPIVVAERLTDGLGMLLIAGVGLTQYSYGWPVFIALLVGAVAIIVVAQVRPLAMRLLDFFERFRLVRRFSSTLRNLYESTYQLLGWRALTLMTVLSAASWFGECVAFYYVLRGLGTPAGPELLLQSSFIFAAGTLFGLASFLPGGLGVADLSYAGLVRSFGLLEKQGAAAAAFLIRLCTLWFGVSLGTLALFVLSRRLGGLEEPDHPGEPQASEL